MMNNRAHTHRTMYVALLRGISPLNATNNVLKSIFATLGFEDIESVNSSGNIIFSAVETDTAAIESTIEKGLLDEIGLVSLCIVRSSQQISDLVAIKPFSDTQHTLENYLTLTFFKNEPDSEVFRTARLDSKQHRVTYLSDLRVLCATFNNSLTKNPTFMSKIERDFGKNITTRTWNTIVKIQQRMFDGNK